MGQDFREVSEAELSAALGDLVAFEAHSHGCPICGPVVDSGGHPSRLCNPGRLMLRRCGRHDIEVVMLAEAVRECPICNGTDNAN